ncbi:hypothetical protein FRC09_009951 [Ceratobasidium sp. 395]|nr:hypothetical protein FRC09_009951 [Ceratobasidium sp. 395]
MSAMNEFNQLEEASGRATRARTRLIVEGFANLALVAILFSGVQAQLISVANDEKDGGKLSMATNAVFFGGLVFSVFAAMLATLSGRWFSILREDDSDYLSSCWLAQDCAEQGTTDWPKLEDYLEFQIGEIRQKMNKEIERASKRNSTISTIKSPEVLPTSLQSNIQFIESPQEKQSPNNPSQPGDETNRANRNDTAARVSQQGDTSASDPIVQDLRRIIKLLQVEKINEKENAEKNSNAPRIKCGKIQPGPTTFREEIVSYTLLSPLVVCCTAFVLFCAGIMMLAWNKQPRPVAIFTSATVLICVLPLAGFFLRHRHKHVIQKLHLARPAL